MAPPEPSHPVLTNPGELNGTGAQEEELKSDLIKVIETFRQDMTKSLKEIQKNTLKQAETLKEEMKK